MTFFTLKSNLVDFETIRDIVDFLAHLQVEHILPSKLIIDHRLNGHQIRFLRENRVEILIQIKPFLTLYTRRAFEPKHTIIQNLCLLFTEMPFRSQNPDSTHRTNPFTCIHLTARDCVFNFLTRAPVEARIEIFVALGTFMVS